MVSYGLVKLGFTSTWFSLLDDVAFWTHKDESSLVLTFLGQGGSSRFDTSLSWSLDARLYFRTPFKFLCPVLFMICCSSKQLWHNWVAHVRLPDWFVKLPSEPAFQHIFFIKFSNILLWKFERSRNGAFLIFSIFVTNKITVGSIHTDKISVTVICSNVMFNVFVLNVPMFKPTFKGDAYLHPLIQTICSCRKKNSI